MNIVIFAGGVGTRLWPLSRKHTPKQFEKIVGEESMLQIAARKLTPAFTWKNIFISTGNHYQAIVRKQLPQIPAENIIIEPEMRDVGPAVGLVTSIFAKVHPDEPIALLWGSDHLVKKEETFRKVLKIAESLIRKDPEKIIFIGQKPRFASQNLGYIEFGKSIHQIEDVSIHEFAGFQYRPHLSTAERFLKDGKHAWNLGYFVTTPKFLWGLFKQFSPELFSELNKIHAAVGTKDYEKILNSVYPKIEKISFDNAVLEKIYPKSAYVISEDLGWSDIGAWEALKEALETKEAENVTQGKVLVEDSADNLIFNYRDQLAVGIDLEGMIMINTEDVLLVCPKNSVPKIKKLVESLTGTEHEHLT